jgi:hypothetical protein
VLDDVERGRFAVQPAGEDALPASLRVAHVELHERAGQLLHLPRGGRLAGAQPHDGIADPHRLAGLQGQVPGNAVALVEEAEHRHALRHRRRPGRDRGDGLGNVDRPGLAHRLAIARLILPSAAIAAGKRCGKDEGGAERKPHARSGVQAS